MKKKKKRRGGAQAVLLSRADFACPSKKRREKKGRSVVPHNAKVQKKRKEGNRFRQRGLNPTCLIQPEVGRDKREHQPL